MECACKHRGAHVNVITSVRSTPGNDMTYSTRSGRNNLKPKLNSALGARLVLGGQRVLVI